jgi:RNA polymerase sigma-70 factor (ECF subfamily)
VSDAGVDRAGIHPGAEVAQTASGFEVVLEAWAPALLRLAWRFTRDGEEARDLVQHALADAWERRQGLRDAQAAGPWLRRILVNRAVNLHRRRRVWRSVQSLWGAEETMTQPAPDAQLDQARQARALHQAVAALPARQAAAITLRYFEGLPVAEVAHALGVDVGTARVHLYRALKKLRPPPGPWEER